VIIPPVIRSFKHKGLELFFTKGDHRKIPAARAARIERMLDRLDVSEHPADMNLPGYRWHPLRGVQEGRYACDVSGNERLTFAFDGKDAVEVDLEDYH
jgi:proteic killer suppression protein